MFPLGAQQLFRYIFWHEDQENSNRLPYIGQKILTCKITYGHVWNQPVRKRLTCMKQAVETKMEPPVRELESARALHAQVSPTSWRVDSNLHDKRPCLETVERQDMGRFVFTVL